MPISVIILLLILPISISDCCNSFDAFLIEPDRVILNSTNKTKLICTKIKDDNLGFEVNLSPNISSTYIQISTNHLNNTALEIVIQSFDYVGEFYLICSSKGKKDCGAHSNITIGQEPGLLELAERCIVYYDKYIDCIVNAPIMAPAILNGLNYSFRFVERRLPSQPDVYRPNFDNQPVKIDRFNKTITFRWFPRDPGNFPLDRRMIIYGTLTDFGTTTYTMNMIPTFRISSNFTVNIVSSTDLRIEFNPGKIPSICQGNLTRDDQIQLSYERENLRTFDESNQTTIRVTGLHPNTWYRLCFHCSRRGRFDTISDLECQRHKTLKTPISLMYIIIIIIFCLLFVGAIKMLLSICTCDGISGIVTKCRHRPRTVTRELADLSATFINQDPIIPQWPTTVNH